MKSDVSKDNLVSRKSLSKREDVTEESVHTIDEATFLRTGKTRGRSSCYTSSQCQRLSCKEYETHLSLKLVRGLLFKRQAMEPTST